MDCKSWGSRDIVFLCIIVLSLIHVSLGAKVRHFKWEVEYMYGAPDCQEHVVMGINGQFPGPTIRAKAGDTIVVDLTNKLHTEGVVIHWHGIRQLGTPWADGTASISQCAINPGETFEYRFKVDRPGTYFYHGHYGMQRSAGLYGSLIVDMADGEKEPFHYDAEFNLLLSDWWHKSVHEQEVGLSSNPFRWIGEPQSLLINGRGQYNCSLAAKFSNSSISQCKFEGNEKCAPQVLKVRPNKTYRLRIASTTALASLNLAIEGHKMVVVEADGNHVQPFAVNDLDIYSGESYSVLLKTDQNPYKNYWVSIGVRGRDPKTNQALTLLSYSATPASKLPTTQPPVTPRWDDYNHSKAFTKSIYALMGSPQPPKTYDRRIILLNTQNRLNGFVKWAINNVSLVLPSTPYLGSIKFGLNNAFDQKTPPDNYDSSYDIMKPAPNQNTTQGSGVYTITLNTTVDVILQNANGDALRVFTIERLGETFNETAIPLRYTPRRFVLQPKRKLLVIIESDQGSYTAEEREAARKECFEAAGMGENGNGNMNQMENGGDDEDKEDPLSDEQYGYPKAESNKWVSCIRVLDPRTASTTCLLELQDNEAAFSVCTVNFHDKEYGTLLAVGTAKGLQFWPKRSLTAGFIHIYRFLEDGRSLELLHKTQVEGVPLALCQFQGRLLAGIGSVLRLYDLGKRRLLRKCENKLFPNTIISIQTYRDRIYVGDIQESFHFCKYRRDENQLYIFADDVVPRWLTASYHIDFDTMAGADKFGNVYFVRLPQDVSDEIEEDPTGGKIKWEQGRLNGAPNKVEEIVQFHVGDVVTSLQKASLIPGGGECVLYGTVMGSLGALLPFTSRDDVDFFSHLEMHMRQEHPPLCGRDHMAYRSAYFPVKDVIDGDLCEQFPTLPLDLQRKIADELDRTPGEILKKLEEARNKII